MKQRVAWRVVEQVGVPVVGSAYSKTCLFALDESVVEKIIFWQEAWKEA